MLACDTMFTEPWSVSLYSQRRIDLSKFDFFHVSITDIAHSLSCQCRYNGHCKYHYSVAQHCVYVHNMLKYYSRADDKTCHAGLLHDASEAYIQDIVRGCKRQLPNYCALEERIQGVIYDHYQIPDHEQTHDIVKYWDNRVLRSEVQVLFSDWENCFPRIKEVEPAYVCIERWTPEYAEERFLGLARYYYRERCQ